ncbi:MAG: preprotein translocase subunit YajC [Bacteroidales bacterium]|nr:preprotein translocase subunit YajC [Candidatus Cacconaster merdequi]
MNFLTFLQTNGQANGGGGMSLLIMMLLIFVVMWLFMIRPQQKKQKELNKFRDALKKGDKVVTIGGIYGTVSEVKEGSSQILLEIDKDVKIKVDKASIVRDYSDAQQA